MEASTKGAPSITARKLQRVKISARLPADGLVGITLDTEVRYPGSPRRMKFFQGIAQFSGSARNQKSARIAAVLTRRELSIDFGGPERSRRSGRAAIH